MSKVVVISTSLRPYSNSNALAEKFTEGARAAGHDVELISLRGKQIKFCIGCLACQKTGAGVFKDDVPAIMESVLNAADLRVHLSLYLFNCPRFRSGDST